MSGESRGLGGRVQRGAIWSTGVTIASLPLAVLSTIVIARTLGARGFGSFSYYTFVTGLVFGLSELGLGSALIQRGAQASGRDDAAGLLGAVRAALSLSLLRVPLVGLIGFLVLPGVLAPSLYALSVLSSLAFIGPSYYLVMTSDLAVPSQLRLLSALLSASGSIAVAVATHDPALTFAAGSLGLNLTTALQIVGVPAELRGEVFRPGRPSLRRSDVTFGLGSFLNGQVTGFVFSRSELLFFSKGAASARGQFAAAETIAARSTLALDSLFGALPTAMATAAGRGPEALQWAFARVSRTSHALLALFGPALGVGVVTVAPAAFGSGFHGVAPLALALTGASLLQTGSLPLSMLRYANRQVGPLLIAGLAAAGLDALLALFLVPPYAAAGATVANVASGIGYALLTTGLLMKDPTWRSRAGSHTWPVFVIVVTSTACGAFALAVGSMSRGLTLGLALAAVATWMLMRTVVKAEELDVPQRARGLAVRLRLVRRSTGAILL